MLESSVSRHILLKLAKLLTRGHFWGFLIEYQDIVKIGLKTREQWFEPMFASNVNYKKRFQIRLFLSPKFQMDICKPLAPFSRKRTTKTLDFSNVQT